MGAARQRRSGSPPTSCSRIRQGGQPPRGGSDQVHLLPHHAGHLPRMRSRGARDASLDAREADRRPD
eukprot:16443566-Heterocapsa_arctica.AAC.1